MTLTISAGGVGGRPSVEPPGLGVCDSAIPSLSWAVRLVCTPWGPAFRVGCRSSATRAVNSCTTAGSKSVPSLMAALHMLALSSKNLRFKASRNGPYRTSNPPGTYGCVRSGLVSLESAVSRSFRCPFAVPSSTTTLPSSLEAFVASSVAVPSSTTSLPSSLEAFVASSVTPCQEKCDLQETLSVIHITYLIYHLYPHHKLLPFSYTEHGPC
jgi:hypothetical protein